MRLRGATIVAAGVAALAFGGCGIGTTGKRSGAISLTVTRDFGARVLVARSQRRFPDRETVMRYLERNAKVEASYGGRFVEAIDGLRSSSSGGARKDWLYYVNGIEADTGAADRSVRAGDRIWWDYHDWGSALRVPAVVGSYPEPFLHGSDGKRFPVRIDCGSSSSSECGEVSSQLGRAGVAGSTAAIGSVAGKDLLRIVVGTWPEVRQDGPSRQLEQGPARSGVYARPRGAAGYALELLAADGHVARTLTTGWGVVAATRFKDQQPTWIVAGADRAGLRRAVAALTTRSLANRFALATTSGAAIRLPVAGASG